MRENDVAIALVKLIKHDAGMWGANELRQLAFAVLKRCAPQVLMYNG